MFRSFSHYPCEVRDRLEKSVYNKHGMFFFPSIMSYLYHYSIHRLAISIRQTLYWETGLHLLKFRRSGELAG